MRTKHLIQVGWRNITNQNTYLSDDPVQDVNEDKVKRGRRVLIETDLQQVIVMRRYTETRQETVDHQIYVLTHVAGPREWP